ncbi:DUF3105 domain-containing protein [Yinghuangia sp. YIM S09857]|uniref:DUF3105 domain-containing protein n=1 Tax=Yinghuangia sp. YIM S09857 TaxID=3436929 RepID=UPI003F531D8D
MGPQQSGSSKKQNKAARNAKMAAARQRVAEQREREAKSARRRSILIGSTAAVIAIGVIAGLAAIVMTSDDGDGGPAGSVDAEVTVAGNVSSTINGVVAYTASRDHVGSGVDYKQVPPVGGKHDQRWLNCGIYDKPVENRNAVHSLEHGAVWITYDPALPADQIEKLKAKANQPYMLLTPYPGMPKPVNATAWGLQLPLDTVDDPRLDEFIKLYRNGPQTPEQGAACTGGVGKPQ